MPAQKTPAKKRSVTLLNDHTHAGKPYKKGAVIEVSVNLIPWLQANHIIAEDK